jgi:hypothetical protein
MIYLMHCKNLFKYHNVPHPPQQQKDKNKNKKIKSPSTIAHKTYIEIFGNGSYPHKISTYSEMIFSHLEF